ncbi:PilN domain-containing protein [Ferrimonas lipolytica]|uniref:PilN domain-containing protein n=1 Tax=Ferrimonas lipolytica TaxID=2724191 RepID=A0A6H1UFP3_9GAMM|nr:PilN domain-containing protein [Ferrimonas lipolytica]QIZ77925.1 PilN domain-containing protein [Ferrimonas lipolytica]
MKTRINLYSATMLPVKPRLTLPLVLGASLLLLVLMLLLGVYHNWQLQQLQQQQQQLTLQKQALTADVAQYSAELAKLTPSLQLQADVAQAQSKLQGLQQIQSLLEHDKFLIEPGFSNLMQDLSKAADKQVWLQEFAVSSGHMRLAGLAQRAAAVPAWIDKLGSQESLRGRALSNLTINGEEGGPVKFEASHQPQALTTKEGQ